MYLPEEFLRHAADCLQMAKSTRDPASKASWSHMAERWQQCAKNAEASDERNRSNRRHGLTSPGG
jgi:hypothetical protein